jgi:hypothetical protein
MRIRNGPSTDKSTEAVSQVPLRRKEAVNRFVARLIVPIDEPPRVLACLRAK